MRDRLRLRQRRGLRVALLGLAWAAPVAAQTASAPSRSDELRVLTWNIWHGGREDGDEVGPARVVDVIRASGADIVAMQETYGSGELIADALGFHFHPRGTNVSIHSRHPILEDISVFAEFKCVGALLELPDTSRVACYSIWLPYDTEIWEQGTRDTSDPEKLATACASSARDLAAMWAAIRERLAGPDYEDVPIVIAGDFNSMSHLDYGEVGVDEYDAVVDWQTSRVLTRAGFRDSYRECNPPIDRAKDSTWTPRFPEQSQDRIDYVYYRARRWRAVESRVVREHPTRFPSDHAALLTVLRRSMVPETERSLRVASYNIRHGAGMDNEVDLARTARVIEGLHADFVGLQEVDLGVRRSGGENQIDELAARLSMHPAFGAFMSYQDGHYGMAVLSRHPIVDVRSVALPAGNEPRVALVVEARLPSGHTVHVVNVHLDWVTDDGFRFAQASALAEHLRTLDTPYVLLGDFNDRPGSRTLALFHELATEAAKPPQDRFTFPSVEPDREIDFVFFAPQASWRTEWARVIDERSASDHRPVLAELRFSPRGSDAR